MNNVYESLDDFVDRKTLDGSGQQRTMIKTSFSTFPPVLVLHLLRSQFDPVTNAEYKVNDR